MRRLALVAAVWHLVLAVTLRAELKPTECAVIYNTNTAASREIAQYYAFRREIPVEQLIGLDLPTVETLSRVQYERKVIPMVREALGRHEWGGRIRCLVTCYDVPLRIGSRPPADDERRLADRLEDRWRQAVIQLRELVDGIRGSDADPSIRPGRIIDPPALKPDRQTLPDLFTIYQEELSKRAARHETLAGETLVEARRQSFEFIVRAEGAEGLTNRAPNAGGVTSNVALRIRQMRERIGADLKRAAALLASQTQPDLEEALPIVADTRGLFGVASVLQKRIKSLRGEDTSAAFDSELALVLWDPYDLSGWQFNDLCYRYRDGLDVLEGDSSRQKTLMVARLDAPTPDLVREMISTSIEVESRGLKGTFYIDARGLSRDTGLFEYDDDLMRLAKIVRRHSAMPLRLDARSEVFQPGDCPDAALYCGWYSLSKYVDAFDFVPGAVAIHIASFELVSLRNDRMDYWCKELLKDGASATFGATEEPYLESFPLPTEFFTRLLTGRYTIVEAFSETKPFNSWRLSLLADPLYNPFKTNPQLPVDWNNKDD